MNEEKGEHAAAADPFAHEYRAAGVVLWRINKANEFEMLLGRATRRGHQLTIPGGKIEARDKGRTWWTAGRELSEETGHIVAPEALRDEARVWYSPGKYVGFFRQVRSARAARDLIDGFERRFRETPPEQRELSALKWVPLRELTRSARDARRRDVLPFARQFFGSISNAGYDYLLR